MSKKIIGVGFDSYDIVGHEYSKARLKLHTLLQDYLELQKETEAARSKFKALKLKKLTLLSEVRFLRQRHKFLSKNRSLTPQEPAIIKPPLVKAAQYRKRTNKKIDLKKEAALQNINHKGKVSIFGMPSHIIHGPMEQSFQRATQASDLNHTVKINSFDVIDLNIETTVKTRAPTFDLNQLSMEEEEEELQEVYELKNSVRSVINGKLNELKLLMYRNHWSSEKAEDLMARSCCLTSMNV